VGVVITIFFVSAKGREFVKVVAVWGDCGDGQLQEAGYTDDECVSVMPPLEEQVTRGGKELVPVKGVKVAQVA
jgi:hypothetical protein